MQKTYILDTSVLIDDPGAFKHFNNSTIIIPIAVINELDKKKLSPGESGRNARVAIRFIDQISSEGDISLGVFVDGSIIKVDTTYRKNEISWLGDPESGDTHILACAISAAEKTSKNEVTLVSNDLNLRIRAKARAINAIGHEGSKYSLSDLYGGSKVIVNEDAGLDLQKKGSIDPTFYGLNLLPNECVLFESENGDGLALGRQIAPNKIKLVKKCYPWGLKSRNKEQSFAIDLMMDKNVDLITLIGKAGTGKSLVVLATALELVLEKKEYEKFVIYRPIQPVGNDIGFLPGTMEEKLGPWFQAIMDNFENLFQSKNGGDWRRELDMYRKKGRIEMDAVTYIRGRSIPNAIILLDECQNLTKEEVKTVLTRAGEGTKIILTGDIEQIDNSMLDATSNGLTYVIEKFKNSELAGHITFTQGERSKLATLASEIL